MTEDDESTRSYLPESAEIPASVVGALKRGDLVGRYEILERLGEGGFATVYAAQQQEPVRRKVALKIIRHGMDSAEVINRFEVERQALAVMDHPHVARVYDAGTTERGRPYFVMEYVAGDPITSYCDRHRVDVRRRLDLFIQACEAAQHAHQKGIIHRDIKPSNVLVTVREGKPLVKMIDFGIAKAISRELTGRTMYTEHGLFLGTPEYMSPEQAEMTGVDIDTRSDIYSLGVLLYELLVGNLPFDPGRLRSGSYVEIQRIIREEDPPRPSTRLGRLGPKTADVARHRRADARSVLRSVRGDLDWIVMRALDKDRTRRYETASSLAADIRRHLNDEPVEAGPPSTLYRAGKFIRRHRVGVAASLTVAVAVLAGAATTTWQAIRATKAERRALVERDRADRRYREARDLADYFMDDFHDAIVDLAGTLPAREGLVERALEYLARLHQETADDVSVKLDLARGHLLVGQILGGMRGPNLNRRREAMEQFETARRIHEEVLAVDPDNLENRRGLVVSHITIADVHRRSENDREARAHYEQALALGDELLARDGQDDRTQRLVLAAALRVGDYARWDGDLDRAAELYDRCVAIVEGRLRRYPDDARALRDSTNAYSRVAELHEDRGDLAAALQSYETVLGTRRAIAEADPDSARTRRDVLFAHLYVADVLGKLGESDRARSHFERALEIAIALHAADSQDERARANVFLVRYHYGIYLAGAGLRDDGLPLLREALGGYEALAADHPDDPRYRRYIDDLRAVISGPG